MYSEGDRIIHPRYGAGVVTGRKSLNFKGEERKYHVVELIGGRGEVMIPIKLAEDMDIRMAIKNLDTIEEVFQNEPNILSDNYRTRQAKINEKIGTRDPRALAQALRDLAWREHVHKLTGVEQKMKTKLIKMLSREMAVIRPNMTIKTATSRLSRMVFDMIEYHQPEVENAPAS